MTRSSIYFITVLLLSSLMAKDRDRNASTTPTLTEKAISAGFNHTLIIQEGNVTAFGENTYGQLGDSSFSYSIPGVPVVGLDHIIAVSAGRRHSMALRADGKVFVWGNNAYMQLGQSGSSSAFPILVPGLSDVIDIQAGDFHCLALKSDGTVISWGINNLGELGRGFTSASELPGNVIDVSGSGNLEGVTLISGGARHSLAILDGNVLAWGDNLNTQLGKLPSSITFSATPDYIMKGKFFLLRLNNVIALSAGETHSMATDVEGKLWTWGEGVYGQLGLGITLDPLDPSTFRRRRATEVASKVRTMAAGYTHSTYIDSKGELHFFGANFHGQFGIPLTTTRVESDSTVGYNKAVALACGTDFTIILKSDGTIVGAGDNAHQQLGSSGSSFISSFSAFSNKVDRIAQVANSGNSYVLKSDGTVWSFGHKDYVGFTSTSHVSTVTQIAILSDIIAIGGTSKNGFALDVNGDLWSWGENESGSCGTGMPSTLHYTSPIKISTLTDIIYVGGSTQGDYGCCLASYSHASAIDVNGDLYTWGQNTNHELGDGSRTRRFSPVKITSAGKVFSTSLARRNTFALYADNTVMAWGRKDDAGISTSSFGPTYITTPTPIITTERIKSMNAKRDVRITNTVKGEVLVWGSVNYYSYPGFFDICQLGSRRTGIRTPSLIFENDLSPTLINNVKFAGLGESFAFFIKADGSTWTWGRNDFGQLGRGVATTSESIPQTIACTTSGYPASMYTAISGDNHVLANQATIAIKSWGHNGLGQLGLGYVSAPSNPKVLSCNIAARFAPPSPVLSTNFEIFEEILIYPNPTSETLHIELPLEIMQQAAELKLIDASGRIVYQQKGISQEMSLPVSQYDEGIYILEVGVIKRRILIRK